MLAWVSGGCSFFTSCNYACPECARKMLESWALECQKVALKVLLKFLDICYIKKKSKFYFSFFTIIAYIGHEN